MPIPIEDFLNIRWAAPLGFSPDARRVLVSSNLTGTMQLYSVPAAGGELTQLTDDDEPVSGATLPERDEIVLMRDAGGNERRQLYLLDARGENRRVLVEDPDYLHIYGGATRDGKTIAYASNRRNGVDFDVYVHDIDSGDERCLFAEGGWAQAAGFSPDGRYLAVLRLTERNSDNQLFLIDAATEERTEILPHDEEGEVGAPSWVPDGSAFFLTTDLGHDFEHLRRYDMRAAADEQVLVEDRDLSCSIDHAGRSLFVWSNEDGYRRIRRFDPRTLAPLGEVPLPRQGMAAGIPSRDGSRFVFGFDSPLGPPDVYLADLDGGEQRRLTTSPNPVPSDVFVEPELHRVTSFDGEQVPVFLYRPRAATAPVPVVVMVHGGPESQYVPSFSPAIQYLVHRGYAVAAPNVRGSTGYGKRYHHLDDVEKRLDSVADLGVLHDWLGTIGGIDASRAALWGGSYGGYMVLAGLAFQPERWAAGVDIVGISSLVTFLENTSPWRRKFREREYGSLERDRAFLESASPITRVDDMRAPLFIIHGANDPRVPVGEARQIHDVLMSKGVPTELLIYEDEGHGLAKLKNRLDAYPKAIDFLDRVFRR